MAITRETQGQLAKGDFAAIEEAWLQRIGTHPDDIDYYVGTARALGGQGHEGRARNLLELLDDQLVEQGRYKTRLVLLRKSGGLYLSGAKMHAAIVQSLEKEYGKSPSYKSLFDHVGLARGADDMAKTWEKADRLQTLLAFDIGAVVTMEGKGVGRIAEVKTALESFKVDFERNPGMTVGFRAAAKLLKALPAGHILRRKLEDAAGLAKLRDEAPSELLREVLQSADRPLSGAEIKELLQGVVSEAQWTSWWSAARKHPQVVQAGSGRQTYGWADTTADASGAAWKSFQAADPNKKMDLLRRHGDRDADLRARMAAELARIGEESLAKKPGLAFEIWYALERGGGVPKDLSYDPVRMLSERDPRPTLVGVADRLLRERGYAIVRERRSDWTQVFADLLLREEDPRALNLLAEGLRAAAPAELDRLVDQLVSQPRKFPAAFVWLAERAGDDEALAARNPLRLAQQLLSALSSDEFAPYRAARLKPLCDGGGSLPRLLSRISEEQAPQAREAVQRAPGLEDYQRTPLLTALELRFPSLRQETETPLYATAASIEARRLELKRLLDVEIPANRKAIEEARALGDLRENFEYKSARQRHEYLASRTATLDRELRRVRPLDPQTIDTGEARIGTRLALHAQDGASRTLTLLGPWESKPEEGVVSYESELGKSLLGKKTGDAVEVEGATYVLDSIRVFSDPA
jgi:transcription elongation GreA/GreB family factor